MDVLLSNVTWVPLAEIEEEAIMSDEIRSVLEQIIIFIMLPLNIMGVITNMINARVFVEQGPKNDTTTIGLLCLSVADFFGCMCMIPYSLCYIVGHVKGVPLHYTCIAYATQLCYPHIVLSHCNTWMTVYISLERSLCVVMPLKVKLLFTPKLIIIAMVSILIIFVADQIPYSIETLIIWVYSPEFNQTIAYTIDTPAGQEYLYINSILSNTVLSSLALVIVAITTAIMIYKLNETKKWRQKNAGGFEKGDNAKDSNKKPLATKEIEVIKSVTTVTGIFLVCLSMSHIPATTVVAFPGVSFGGINRNLFYTVYMVRFLFDAINASINFFFFIRISSRYKAAFSKVFLKSSK